MHLSKHHYALAALAIRNSTRKIRWLKKEKPERWRALLEHENKKLRAWGGTLKVVATHLDERDRQEAYDKLEEDPILEQSVLKYNGEVIGKRVVRESGEVEDVLPLEYPQPIVSKGVIVASDETYKAIKEREEWVL